MTSPSPPSTENCTENSRASRAASKTKRTIDVSGVWWNADDAPRKWNFQQIFGNNNPVELDIGCGKGLFLFNQSQLRPNVNFLGVDWSRPYSRMAAERIVRNQIPNVRVIADNVWNLLPQFADRSFQAIHAYFPDPWWKRKHWKRRLFRTDLLEQIHRLLTPHGQFCIATDVREYFIAMQSLLSQSPRLRQLPDPQPSSATSELDFLTHFERKYRKAGRAIYRAQYAIAAPEQTTSSEA